MRETKAQWQAALLSAARFNYLPLQYVGTSRAYRGAEEVIRNRQGFIPVCQYGRGMLELRGEFGTDGKTRYLWRAA